MRNIRFILPFILLLTYSNSSKSQVIISLIFGDALNSPNTQFGLEVGANVASVTNYELTDLTGGFQISMFLNWKFSEKWSLYNNLIANSNRGYRGNGSLIDSIYVPENDYELSYMKVRLMYGGIQSALRYHISPSFSVAAGLNLGLLFRATEEALFQKEDSELNIVYKVTDDYTRLDVGPSLALLYQFRKGKGISIIARTYYGLVDVAKEVPGHQNSYYFQLTAGILIGAKSKNEMDEVLNPE